MKTTLLTVFLFLTVTSTHVLAVSAQKQIDQLQAELNALQSQVDQQPRQLVLLDANDKRVGDVLAILRGSRLDLHALYRPQAVINIRTAQASLVNLITRFNSPNGINLESARLLWDQPNCEGNVIGIEYLADRSGQTPLVPVAGLFGQVDTSELFAYIPDSSIPSTSVNYESWNWGYITNTLSGVQLGFSCLSEQGSFPALQVKEVIDLSGEAATWVSPLRIEVAP